MAPLSRPLPLLALVCALGACTANVKPVQVVAEPGWPFPPLPDKEPVLVGLAVSGGGSRAATFTAGALAGLAEVAVTEVGRTAPLLERVQVISSVSGGSLAAAYYALEKPGRNIPMRVEGQVSKSYKDFFARYQEAMMADFEEPTLWRQIFKFRAGNSGKRADSFAEVWDAAFFRERKFADLYQREAQGDSPRLILNGTRWNDGRRFLFTTLPLADFDLAFARPLIAKLRASPAIPAAEMAHIDDELRRAYGQFVPASFENLGKGAVPSDLRDVRISLAVAGSASVPALIGPVSFQADNDTIRHHIGDGGLFDNQGIESLTELFLKKLNDPRTGASRRALIIMIDAAYPFGAAEAELNAAESPLAVLAADPMRIQGMMEQRAQAYQLALWSLLHSEHFPLLSGDDRLRVIHLRHTDAPWPNGYADLPSACLGKFKADATAAEINAYLGQIPTLLHLRNDCDGPLLIEAAKRTVSQAADRIRGFFAPSAN